MELLPVEGNFISIRRVGDLCGNKKELEKRKIKNIKLANMLNEF